MLSEWYDEFLLGSSQDRFILLSSVSTQYTPSVVISAGDQQCINRLVYRTGN